MSWVTHGSHHLDLYSYQCETCTHAHGYGYSCISIFTKNFLGLVQAYTSLYQLVPVIKVHQVKSQQAKSKSWQVFCLKLFLDSASHDKLARPYKFSNFCSHWFHQQNLSLLDTFHHFSAVQQAHKITQVESTRKWTSGITDNIIISSNYRLNTKRI